MAWIMAPSMPGRRRFYGMVWAVGVAAEPAGPHSFLCRVGLQLHMASGCVGRRLCLRVRTCSQCSIQVVERDEHAARLLCTGRGRGRPTTKSSTTTCVLGAPLRHPVVDSLVRGRSRRPLGPPSRKTKPHGPKKNKTLKPTGQPQCQSALWERCPGRHRPTLLSTEQTSRRRDAAMKTGVTGIHASRFLRTTIARCSTGQQRRPRCLLGRPGSLTASGAESHHRHRHRWTAVIPSRPAVAVRRPPSTQCLPLPRRLRRTTTRPSAAVAAVAGRNAHRRARRPPSVRSAPARRRGRRAGGGCVRCCPMSKRASRS